MRAGAGASPGVALPGMSRPIARNLERSSPGVALGAHLALLLACACGGEAAPTETADLPAGWESATRVAGLVQSECGGSPYETHDERVAFEAGEGSIGITYSEAHFRCSQDVEAFLRDAGEELSVLVQPRDMDPESVARCDCLYEITMQLEPVTAGEHAVTLYRRWDNLNEPNEPAEIGGQTVLVR